MVSKSHIGVENSDSLQAVDASISFHISESGGLPACAHICYLLGDTRKRLCLVEAPKPELPTVPACLSCQVLQGEAEAQSVFSKLV